MFIFEQKIKPANSWIVNGLSPAHSGGVLNIFRVAIITGCVAVSSACQLKAEKEPSTHCRFIPARSDDFAWENDLIAFRAYGPTLRKNAENAGIDCWLKRVKYPIVDKWYQLNVKENKSYHVDHGESLDSYKVGASAGCGGTSLWLNKERQALETFTEWKVLERTKQKSVFVLTYVKDIAAVRYKEEKGS